MDYKYKKNIVISGSKFMATGLVMSTSPVLGILVQTGFNVIINRKQLLKHANNLWNQLSPRDKNIVYGLVATASVGSVIAISILVSMQIDTGRGGIIIKKPLKALVKGSFTLATGAALKDNYFCPQISYLNIHNKYSSQFIPRAIDLQLVNATLSFMAKYYQERKEHINFIEPHLLFELARLCSNLHDTSYNEVVYPFT